MKDAAQLYEELYIEANKELKYLEGTSSIVDFHKTDLREILGAAHLGTQEEVGDLLIENSYQGDNELVLAMYDDAVDDIIYIVEKSVKENSENEKFIELITQPYIDLKEKQEELRKTKNKSRFSKNNAKLEP